MTSFVRMTKLNNLINRVDYINSKHQENIVLKSADIDWSEYVEFEKENKKSYIANNEGRELIIALPNEFAAIEPIELKKRIDLIATTATQKSSSEIQYIVLWNSRKNNLYMHVIFSERNRNLNFINLVERWERNIYLTADGKVAKTKKDRAIDEYGNYFIKHKKGELKAKKFTAKNKIYTSLNYSLKTKEKLEQLMIEKWNVQFDDKSFIHQYHCGKGSNEYTQAIKAKNELVCLANTKISQILKEYSLSENQIQKIIKDSLILINQNKEPYYFVKKEANKVGILVITQHEKIT